MPAVVDRADPRPEGEARRHGARHVLLGPAAASGTSRPRARYDASAEARVQPVPWVCRLSSAGSAEQCSCVPSVRRSTASPGRWPPLTRTHRGPRSSSAAAAGALLVSIVDLRRRRAAPPRPGSGVTTVASGQQRVAYRVDRLRGQQRVAVLATRRPGSTTTGSAGGCRAARRRRPPSPRTQSIPVFTASTPMSSTTLRNCARTASARQLPDALHAERVLRGDRRDHAHTVHAEREHRLQVGLDAGPAAGVRAGHGQHPRGSTAGHGTPPARKWSWPGGRSGTTPSTYTAGPSDPPGPRRRRCGTRQASGRRRGSRPPARGRRRR